MATATKKVHGARPVSEAASLAFRTYQDNGGNYHWEIAGRSGEILAHSGSFTSQDDAERAARKVHECVRSARFEPHVAIERQTVAV